jgi:hypothetical protein
MVSGLGEVHTEPPSRFENAPKGSAESEQALCEKNCIDLHESNIRLKSTDRQVFDYQETGIDFAALAQRLRKRL